MIDLAPVGTIVPDLLTALALALPILQEEEERIALGAPSEYEKFGFR